MNELKIKIIRNKSVHDNFLFPGVTGGDELWRYCISDTDSVLGFALGAMFVKEAFNGRSKDKVCINNEHICSSCTVRVLFLHFGQCLQPGITFCTTGTTLQVQKKRIINISCVCKID